VCNLITSKQIINLFEEYLTLIKPWHNNEPVEVFVNPTSSDISRLVMTAKKANRKLYSVRVVIDANQKKVYIADDNICLHADICSAIHVNVNDPFIYSGVAAAIDNGKLRLLKWSMHRFTPEQFKRDWSFVDKYITGFNDALKTGRWNP
jgi:hypothetical protein